MIMAYSLGNPDYLTAPFDPDHNACGYGKAKDYPVNHITI
jgi:hypothetical protein